MRHQSFMISVVMLGSVLVAQSPSLRERVAEEQTDVDLTISVDGPPMVFANVLEDTILVVRAIVGQAVSHLSEDGRDIYTSYELLRPQVFFSATVAQASRPGVVPPRLSLRQRGGTVRIDRFNATVGYSDAAKLSPGMDVIVLLHPDGGQYRIAGGDGMFEVRDSRIVPLVGQGGEHQKFAGMNADAFLAELLTRLNRLHKK
jgi:hypothetical protein